MAALTRTWWGKRFIAALEGFTDPGRLGRGRSYARSSRIQKFSIRQGQVKATVEGNINPYFGVYKTPYYSTTVEMIPIAENRWPDIIKHLAGHAGIVAKLLMNEMPDEIEEAFTKLGVHLLPRSGKDFKTQCSCPDYYNPCKHIAGLCYFFANKLDQDPFLLFELRGLPRNKLRDELAKTPLGKALAQSLEATELPLQPVESYYTRPQRIPMESCSYDRFWSGEHRLSTTLEPLPPLPVLPAVLVRKGGDYPPFWQQDRSFIEVMSEFYERVRKQLKETG
ncbi:MAG: SWIM zinc finger family protein [Candidatus Competibacteraceae bacterium]